MELWQKIIEALPELDGLVLFENGIELQDDSDGVGAYIREWNYSKPIPKGLKLGKPSA
jgi:hypothetical protein